MDVGGACSQAPACLLAGVLQSATMGGMTGFRNYEAPSRPSVNELYRLKHRHQTLDFVRTKERDYLPPRRGSASRWSPSTGTRPT